MKSFSIFTILLILTVNLSAQNRKEQILILTNRIDSLAFENNNKDSTIHVFEKNTADLIENVNQLNNKIGELNNSLSSKELVIQKITEDLESANQRISVLEKTIKENGSKYNSLLNITDSLKKSGKMYQNKLDFYRNFNEISLIQKNNEKIPLSEFPDATFVEKNKSWMEYNVSDIDNDGKLEVLISYFNGGANCCLEYNLFEDAGENAYKFVRYFGDGGLDVKLESDKIRVSFSEQLNYFFACRACYIDREMPGGTIISDLIMVKKNNRLIIDSNNESRNVEIIKALEFLKDRGIRDLEVTNEDDGTRKAYAMLVISYYFNNNSNLSSTESIFQKYYGHQDRQLIWDSIKQEIEMIKSKLNGI